MKIVTGARGEAHITSNDDQGLHQGIFGDGNYVLNVGQKFTATLTDANTVSISDGEGVLQGVHFRVLPGTVDTVTIENGTTGYNRIDLICARYTKNADTGYENVEWAVIKGTPNASTPTAPTCNEGDVLGGDLIVDFPIFKVEITGLTPVLSRIAVSTHHSIINLGNYTGSDSSKTVDLSELDPGLYIIFLCGTTKGADQGSFNYRAQIKDGNTTIMEKRGYVASGNSSAFADLYTATPIFLTEKKQLQMALSSDASTRTWNVNCKAVQI